MQEGARGLAIASARLVPSLTIRRHPDAPPGGRGVLVGDGGEVAMGATGAQPAPVAAQVVCRDGEFFVVSSQLGSAAVNGRPVRGEVRLRDGDVVNAGGSELRFDLRPAEAAKSLRPAEAAESEAAAPGEQPDLAMAAPDRVIRVADFIRKSRALHVLSHATAGLLAHPPTPELFERVLDPVFEAVAADFAAIMLLESDPPRAVEKASRSRGERQGGVRISGSIVRRAIESREAVLVADVLEDAELCQQPSIVAAPIGCAICAPLWVAAGPGEPVKVIGVLYATSGPGRARFSTSDLEILTVLANTAAINIEIAALLDARLEQQRMREELRVAAEIQAGLLPRQPPCVPGYDLATRTQSSRAVGGDFHDVLTDGPQLHLALGDVAGKGVGAALLMVELRSTVRAHWREGELREAAARINRQFHDNVPHDRYATFFLARLAVATGRLTYVNAGHNPPLLLKADGRCDNLVEGGTVFGAFPDSEYLQAEVDVAPGETLIVYSDGISEAWPDPGLAERELCAIARSLGHQGAARVQEAIFEAAERREPGKARDDRTLIVLQRNQ